MSPSSDSSLHTSEESEAGLLGSASAVRRSALRRRKSLGEIVMIAPALVLVSVLILGPIFVAFGFSLTDWNGFTMPPNWVGLENYGRIFTDERIVSAAILTALITVVGTIACNVIGLSVALLLNRPTRINSLGRTLVFYPFVVGPIIIGFLWSAILGSNGAINATLVAVGLDKLPFTSDPSWATASLIGVIVWSTFGINVVLYLAALQTIPEPLLEAAKIDGASPFQTFWNVSLPLLAPAVTVNVILVAIGFLRTYELVLSFTSGGPAGATETVVFSILSTSFARAQLGFGAAQSFVLLVMIIAVTLVITRLRRKSEEAVSA